MLHTEVTPPRPPPPLTPQPMNYSFTSTVQSLRGDPSKPVHQSIPAFQTPPQVSLIPQPCIHLSVPSLQPFTPACSPIPVKCCVIGILICSSMSFNANFIYFFLFQVRTLRKAGGVAASGMEKLPCFLRGGLLYTWLG